MTEQDPDQAREAPRRPEVTSANVAPVLVKLTPPFEVRLSQFFWIISFAVGAFAVVFLFVVREELLPLIEEVARRVTDGRSDETYTSAADILFWIVFGALVAVLLVQITLMVSFTSRRPNVRWWQLSTLALLALVVVLSPEWVALGSHGAQFQAMIAAQAGLVVLALLCSILPRAMSWSARRVDVRRGPAGVQGHVDL
ncbi:hypothetical protein SRABI121_03033 [Microbacterium sp. Bi121]|nr:hypothetical protein SRABI121_03033 [Microbacterium sp. Bi121]